MFFEWLKIRSVLSPTRHGKMELFDLRKWEGSTSAKVNLAEPACIDQIAIDSRRIDSPHSLFVALKGEKEDGHQYVEQAARLGAKFALVSNQWKPPSNLSNITLLPVSNPLQSLQSIAKSYRLQLPTKIIGLTGSFGKTMVKDLLHTLLQTEKCTASSPESFNSQIGVALSLLTLRKEHEVAIIETAISHPSEMDLLAEMIRPDYTIITPIGKKHLATLDNLSTLVEEMMKLALSTSSEGWALLPREVQNVIQAYSLNCPFFFWSDPTEKLPHAVQSTSHPLTHYQITFPDSLVYHGEIKKGHAYFLNLINMAAKAAWSLGISSHNIVEVLKAFQPEPTRTEIWKSTLGTIFINDPYCSDPQSVDHALQHFEYASNENRKIFVFGGMRMQFSPSPTDYKRVGQALAKSHVNNLILVGQKPFKSLIEEVQHSSPETEIIAFDNYEESFSFLQTHLRKEDIIIFKGENKLSLENLTERFNDSLANNQCIINLAAIKNNLTLLRKHLPKATRVMVMVKALAYGTNDIQVSKFLAKNGVDILGVSYVDEAVALKRSGVIQSIFSINAAPYEVAKVVKWDLEVGVSDRDLILALAHEAARYQKRIKVHLHINTGMGRFGCRPEEALALAQLIASDSSLEFEGIMTHFACAEDPQQDSFTQHQIKEFDKAIAEIEDFGIFPKWKHAANSSAALRFHLPQYNMVRPGLAIYGLYGSAETKKQLDLTLAVSLTSRIVGINICKKGDSISYGRKYQVKRDMQKIAVLPIGYFDGLHRHYSEKAHVMIHGQLAPMVGNICMDNVMVDVTDIPSVQVGDKVLIFGEDEYGYYLSPEDLALSGNSIVHELMTCLGPRIPRIFMYEEGKQFR